MLLTIAAAALAVQVLRDKMCKKKEWGIKEPSCSSGSQVEMFSPTSYMKAPVGQTTDGAVCEHQMLKRWF